MNKEEAAEKGYDVEPYGGGFILTDYSGNRGEASFRGVANVWSRQPLISDPFPTEDEAWAVAD